MAASYVGQCSKCYIKLEGQWRIHLPPMWVLLCCLQTMLLNKNLTTYKWLCDKASWKQTLHLFCCGYLVPTCRDVFTFLEVTYSSESLMAFSSRFFRKFLFQNTKATTKLLLLSVKPCFEKWSAMVMLKTIRASMRILSKQLQSV